MAELEDGVVIKIEDDSPVLCLESYEDGEDVLSLSHFSSPLTSRSALQEGCTRRRRTKKNDFCLDMSEEESMLEFLHDNPVLWNNKLIDYRRTEKKSKIWKEQANLMGKTTAHLQGWFKSLRDTHTRLHKKKGGDGVYELTEREQWIKTGFGFLRSVMRHRTDPHSSVKVSLSGDQGQGADEEEAEVEFQDGLEDEDSTSWPSHSSSTVNKGKRKRTQGNDDHTPTSSLQNRVQEYPVIMDYLHNKANESVTFLDPPHGKDRGSPAFVDLFPNTAFEPTNLSRIYQQQIAVRGVFANYVRDSLITMPEHKYKRVRSAINKILTAAMEDDVEEDNAQTSKYTNSLGQTFKR